MLGPTTGIGSADEDVRADAILEAAAEFYRQVLWDRQSTSLIRSFLARHGIEELTAVRFNLGYAPIGWAELTAHLHRLGHPVRDMVRLGITDPSHRGRWVYDRFRSRVMFPVRRGEGDDVRGFIGLATHPGPSWPRWVVSPDTSRFRATGAIFGIDHAATEIRRTGEVRVLDDCLEVLRHHQRGSCATVAVVRSHLTAEHVSELEHHGASRLLRGSSVR